MNLNQTKLDAKSIFKQLSKVHELPTLSAVAVQVNTMLEDINISAQELARVIEKDHAIVPKLLKLVNSAFFGFRNKISNIAHAIMLVGFNTVRNAVVSISVIDSFADLVRNAEFDIVDSWRHAIGVGVVSQFLDRKTGGRYQETAFTAGLIHDIGKLIMLRYYTDEFLAILKVMQKERKTFSDAENRLFPIPHSVIGSRLAMQWKLPEELTMVIAYHHKPDCHSGENGLPVIVHTADAFYNNALGQNPYPNVTWPICKEAWKLMPEEMRWLKEETPMLKGEIAATCRILLEGKR